MISEITAEEPRAHVLAVVAATEISVSAYASELGLCAEQLLSFMRGTRPAEPKAVEGLGFRRITTFTPCPCFKCSLERGRALPPVERQMAMARYFLCETCGNKRCPHAANHRHECSGSNGPGQAGSLYE